MTIYIELSNIGGPLMIEPVMPNETVDEAFRRVFRAAEVTLDVGDTIRIFEED